jgi:hypothetical protein
MKLVRHSAAFALVASTLAACSSRLVGVTTSAADGGSPAWDASGSGSATGSIGMSLAVAPGITLQAVTWTIAGPSGPYDGSVSIGQTQALSFITGGIPAGGPYTIVLSGTDTAGESCTGSGTFSIAALAVTHVAVTIDCFDPTDAGIAADVDPGADDAGANAAPVYNCPTIASFAITPPAVEAGQGAQLSVSTTVAPGGSAGTKTIAWAANPSTVGSIDDPTSATTVFECSGPGEATITVTVGLTGSVGGIDAGNVCSGSPGSSASGSIECEGPG